MSICHKLIIPATKYSRTLIFQTINSVRLNNLRLKLHPSGCKDIATRKCEFVAKAQLFNEEDSGREMKNKRLLRQF